jgi:Sulfotransferase family
MTDKQHAALSMSVLISHIPKTAGSSLKRLVDHFNPDTTFVYGAELALGNPNVDFVTRFRNAPKPAIVMGHFSYSVHRLLGIPPAYVTVLREPIARVVSLYRHERSSPESPFAAHFKAGISLKEFVSKEITEMTNNHMCRMVAGIPPEAGLLINEQWLLELAMHNLKRHFVLVGTLEKFEEFVSALAQRFNWGAFDIPRENEAVGASVEVDKQTHAAIVDRNTLDIKLFEYVSHNSGTT